MRHRNTHARYLEEDGIVASGRRLGGSEVLEQAIESSKGARYFKHERRQILLKRTTIH